MQIIQRLSSILILKLISAIFVNCFMDVKLVQDYFTEKQINHATVVECFNKREKMQAAKLLSFNTQRIIFLNINTIDGKMRFIKTTHDHIGVVLDGDCHEEKVKRFLMQCGYDSCFHVKHHWIILTIKRNFSNVFQDVELYINADIHVIYQQRLRNSTKMIVEDVYNPASTKGGQLKRRILGTYNRGKGYIRKDKEYKYWIRRNMTGVTLQSIVVLPVPFKVALNDYLQNVDNPEINTFNRFHHDTLSSCVNFYNFMPNISLDKSWGYLQSDGTFDGLVGALERKLVDYGTSPLFVRSDRAEVMEYGRQTWTLRAAFIFRNPRRVNTAQIFINPFTSTVWISLIFVAIFSIFVFKCNQLFENRHICKLSEANWSFWTLNTVAVFCQQGINKVPYLNAGRIALIFLLICSLVTYQFYSASIVSSLLMKPKILVRTLENLLSSPIKIGCEDTLYTKDYLRYTTDKIARELYLKKILGQGNTSNFLNAHDGIALVRKGDYAFHVEVATAYPLISKTFTDMSICELREIQMYNSQPMHANVQKNSPFRDMFDTCLQRMAEYGILYRQIRFWHPKKPECVQSTTILTSLSLDYFYPLLVLLSTGIFVSLMILMLELYVSFRERSKQSDRSIYPFIN